MKNSLFLWATLTLSSALYAQPLLSRQAVEDIFAQYNPQLMEQSSQNAQIREMVEQVITACLQEKPQDTLEDRYTLIALVRNFENSLALEELTDQYKQAVLTSLLGNPDVKEPARTHARDLLVKDYAKIWAVSVQVKESLLDEYKRELRGVSKDKTLTLPEQKARQARLKDAIQGLQADLNELRTDPGKQLLELADSSLDEAQAQVRARWVSLEAKSADNLQVKTKHKKPVAE